MKLQDYANGRVFASDGRVVYAGVDPGSLEPLGRVPVSQTGLDGLRVSLMTDRPGKSVLEAIVGRFPTANVRAVDDRLVATVGREIFHSSDGGRTWRRSRSLPPSSVRMGVLPSAIAVVDGDVYLGEYPLATDARPRLVRSRDGGRSWETVREFPDVRHVHAVQNDPYDDAVWLTTGDVDEACRFYRYLPADDEIRLVGGGSQDWRAVELALTPDAVLWGMDCVYADRNLLYKLPRDALGQGTPTPEAVGELDASVYYATTLHAGGTHWAVFSTAVEVGGDSTAPDTEARSSSDDRAVVVASPAASGFTEWYRVASYRRGRCLSDVYNPAGVAPVANAYVFLLSSPDASLLLNPYNTRRHDGEIRTVPASELIARSDRLRAVEVGNE